MINPWHDLAARLETLTGPDLEVDARIHHASFPDQVVLLDPGSVRVRRKGVYGPLSAIPLDGWSDWEGLCLHINAARYTASADAALAFKERVLPGWTYSITNTPDAMLRPGEFRCDIRAQRGRACAGGIAPTLPLAILKALAKSKMQEDKG